MMQKRTYGLSWIVGLGAVAILASDPALAAAELLSVENEPEAAESVDSAIEADSTNSATASAEDRFDLIVEESIAPEPIAEELLVQELIAQELIAQVEPIAITEIQVETTDVGFTLQVDASGELPEPETSIAGNAAIVDNLDTDYERFFIAPTVAIDLDDHTDLTVSFEFIEDNNPADFGTLAFGDGIADIPPERAITDPQDVIDKTYWNLGYNLEHRFSDRWTLRNQFRYVEDRYNYDVLALPFSLDEEKRRPRRKSTGGCCRTQCQPLVYL